MDRLAGPSSSESMQLVVVVGSGAAAFATLVAGYWGYCLVW